MGQINITAGTKGGRVHEVDRWVPVSKPALRALGKDEHWLARLQGRWVRPTGQAAP